MEESAERTRDRGDLDTDRSRILHTAGRPEKYNVRGQICSHVKHYFVQDLTVETLRQNRERSTDQNERQKLEHFLLTIYFAEDVIDLQMFCIRSQSREHLSVDGLVSEKT